MMSKKNKTFKSKKIKFGVFIICCFISILTLTTYAKTSEVTVKKVAKKEATKCTKEYVNAKYNPKIKLDVRGDDVNVKISLDSVKNDIAFWYFLYDTVNKNYIVKESAIVQKESSFAFARKNKADEFISIFVATTKDASIGETSDKECLRVDYDRAFQFAEQYIKTLKLEDLDLKDGEYVKTSISLLDDASVDDSEGLEENSSLKATTGACWAFRNGNAEYFASQDDTFKERFNKYNPKVIGDDKYKNSYLTYCYSNNVPVDHPKKEVILMIKNALAEVAIDEEVGAIASFGSLSLFEHLESVGDVIKYNYNSVSESVGNTDALKCDKFAMKNTQTYYVSAKETQTYESGNKCVKECEELVTVEYGPPQATKAGLCFEYEVQVKSEVNCQTKYTGTKPLKSNYKVCKIKPRCNDDTVYSDQAGPEEEFDSCISDCDGGKYSQKCIDRCYKKVYGNTIYIDLSYVDKQNPTNMTYSLLNDNKLNCTDENAIALRAELLEKENCSYKYNGDAIVWSCPSDVTYWEKLGRYYFETQAKAKQTLKSMSDYAVGGVYKCTEARAGRPGRHYRYYIDQGGFKRWCGNYGNLTSEVCYRGCNEVCYWYIDQSTGSCNPKENPFYNGQTGVITPASHVFLNNSDLEEDYAAALSTYTEEVKKCKSEAVCNTTSSTFTIEVNNDYIDKSGVIKTNKVDFSAVVSEKGNITGDKKIILKADGTCYENATSPQALVKWSIPGTWINNKTGDIKYDTSAGSGWSFKKNNFCTMLNSANVNTKWWNWKLLSEADESVPGITEKKEEAKAAAVAETPKYNIKATAKNFGKFKFNIEVQCFYAIDENPTTPPPGELNYRIRSVDTTDLFPSEDGIDTNTSLNPSATGRAAGFNWTDAAKNNNNPDYEIDPVSLIGKIQTTTDTYESSNLDYEFVLDRSSLIKLKNKKSNFTQFGSKFLTTNGLYSYKSNIINDPSNFNSSKINRKIGCNNSLSNSACE